MVGAYNSWLVLLSVVAAVVASYVALELASRVASLRGHRSAWYWMAGGAVSIGSGIWSMHFIGMLAYHLPIPLSYDPAITVLSLALAIVVGGIGLHEGGRGSLHLPRLLTGGLLLGMGMIALLVEQVTGRVRWRETMVWLAGEGEVTLFAEAGAGKVLTGMARRIAPDAQAVALNTPADLEAFARLL